MTKRICEEPAPSGEEIRAARLAAGRTQAEMAEEIGCSALAVSLWERGVRTPRGRMLLRLLAWIDWKARRTR